MSLAIAAFLGGSLLMNPVHAERPRLLPVPQRIEWQRGRARVSDSRRPYAAFVDATGGSPQVAAGIERVNARLRELGAKALPVVDSAPAAHVSLQLIWIGTPQKLRDLEILTAKQQRMPPPARVPDGYVLRSTRVRGPSGLSIIGHDERGCFYALQTLSQLLEQADGDRRSVLEKVVDPGERVGIVGIGAAPHRRAPRGVGHTDGGAALADRSTFLFSYRDFLVHWVLVRALILAEP